VVVTAALVVVTAGATAAATNFAGYQSLTVCLSLSAADHPAPEPHGGELHRFTRQLWCVKGTTRFSELGVVQVGVVRRVGRC
jgi:hypothetical protein